MMDSPSFRAMTSSADALKSQAEKVIARCRKIATFSEQAGCTTRTFLSPPMRDCHCEVATWLKPLGIETTIDAAGNLRAVYIGLHPKAPRLLIGSHLDTVPNAGAFDGVLGVVMGAALLELLHGTRLPFAIELIGFSEEEGVRFKTPFIGSRALAGTLDEKLLGTKDGQGTTMRDAIRNFGLDPDAIHKAAARDYVFGYFEFHIEQGPVLESLDLPLATVEAIAGQSRTELTFLGRANHAGTTPMHLRRDAIAGAAEWILAVEREAQRVAGLVATAGVFESSGSASNVVCGEAKVTLDVRHSDDRVREMAAENLLREAEEVASRRGLSVNRGPIRSQPAVAMDAALVKLVEEAVRGAGCESRRMVSGAGHDAMILAEKIPTAMIFLRTPGGISHSPEENVLAEDVKKALAAGLNFLGLLASSQTVTNRRSERA